jgi:two-component system CheB/CheR fusion protein
VKTKPTLFLGERLHLVRNVLLMQERPTLDTDKQSKQTSPSRSGLEGSSSGNFSSRVQEHDRSNSDLRGLLENTRIATIVLDNETRVINYTPALAELFHVAESDIGRPIADILPRISYDDLQDDVRRVMQTLGSVDREIVDAASGNHYMVRVLPCASVDHDAGGAIVTIMSMTPLDRTQHALRESELHTKLLLTELQHRVRNTLAVIRSISRRTAATSDTVDDYAMHLEGRIEAFARAQAIATRSPDYSVDLEDFVREEFLALAVRDDETVRIDGPTIRLRAKAADCIGLAIHELATNSVKYGALSGNGWRIDLSWRVEEIPGSRKLRLEWWEKGTRVAGIAPRRRGFGSELIERTLHYELDAETELEFMPGGVRCMILIPLNDQTAAMGLSDESGMENEDAGSTQHPEI